MACSYQPPAGVDWAENALMLTISHSMRALFWPRTFLVWYFCFQMVLTRNMGFAVIAWRTTVNTIGLSWALVLPVFHNCVSTYLTVDRLILKRLSIIVDHTVLFSLLCSQYLASVLFGVCTFRMLYLLGGLTFYHWSLTPSPSSFFRG